VKATAICKRELILWDWHVWVGFPMGIVCKNNPLTLKAIVIQKLKLGDGLKGPTSFDVFQWFSFSASY
jgi:hypothetical protein